MQWNVKSVCGNGVSYLVAIRKGDGGWGVSTGLQSLVLGWFAQRVRQVLISAWHQLAMTVSVVGGQVAHLGRVGAHTSGAGGDLRGVNCEVGLLGGSKSERGERNGEGLGAQHG